MLAAPVPSSEDARLAALVRYDVLDTAPEDSFSDIALLASQICGMPMSAVSFVDADREYFKARVGIDVQESPRDISFCAHTILEQDLLVIPDTAADSRFADNPHVRSGSRIRFYAGAPLITGDGHAVGALCVRDSTPHELTDDQRDALRALGRQVVAQLELRRLLIESREQAETDALTGLGNRRLLFADLERQIVELGHGLILAVFDLDGFKQYNDTFGHPAGDSLLVRIGAKLAGALGGIGTAYRMGGDEFCTTTTVEVGIQRTLELGRTALSERGQGFAIGCSAGHALVPTEADTTAAALQLADERMYADKHTGRVSAAQQTREVLVRLLSECQPELHDHSRLVCDLAMLTADKLGLDPADRENTLRAAELHDIGKIAIPNDLLNKPGPLSNEEWAYMQTHTLLGERILSAATSMQHIAALVRSSHERWDGAGYPDGLTGEQIPLGARIVFVCDTYEAMTADRPYRSAVPHHEAIAELVHCSGTQFDPRVVAAFVATTTDLATDPRINRASELLAAPHG